MEDWKRFHPKAIIFDKDGTLIDFNFMWGGWTAHLAGQIQRASGIDSYAALSCAFGFDPQTNKTLPDGLLASAPMDELRRAAKETLRGLGLSRRAAESLLSECWRIPDPESLARPLANLRVLFSALRENKIKIGIITSDNRAPTLATLRALDLESYLDGLICADDGFAPKPAPDSILKMCADWGVTPAHVMMVGDTARDMHTARAAGIGRAVGVLSGVAGAADLFSVSDVLIDSAEALTAYAQNKTCEVKSLKTQNAAS